MDEQQQQEESGGVTSGPTGDEPLASGETEGGPGPEQPQGDEKPVDPEGEEEKKALDDLTPAPVEEDTPSEEKPALEPEKVDEGELASTANKDSSAAAAAAPAAPKKRKAKEPVKIKVTLLEGKDLDLEESVSPVCLLQLSSS